jgi:predicted MFS family arabinose efflux permease
LADRFNRRNLIAIAVAVWSCMTALSGLATSIVQLSLARVGVGIGEAGCSPPAHSMIADYYPPEQRSTAMGIFTLGISGGIMIAYLAGGWVAQNIGWREAFLLVGLPGIVLALIVRFTIDEPVRGSSEQRIDTAERPGILAVAKFLRRRKSFLHMALGAGLASFGGYAVISFFPSFLVRSHGMSVAEIGVYMGLIVGIGGGLGFAGGGYIADKVGRRNKQHSLWVVSAATMIAWLFAFPIYLLENRYVVIGLLLIPAIFTNFYLATTIAQTQSLVRLRMRAVASALLLFVLNIIGLGLGPQITGILSDVLSEYFGNESMRYSLLLVIGITAPWSAYHYYIAGKYLADDLQRVNEN